jgi:hypothetical protein
LYGCEILLQVSLSIQVSTGRNPNIGNAKFLTGSFLQNLPDTIDFAALDIDIRVCCPGECHEQDLSVKVILLVVADFGAAEDLEHVLQV